jgi:branched-chain amino acid transport system permease protein
MLFVLGIVFYNLLIKPILKAPPLNQALITLGVSIFLKNLAMLLFTANPQSIQLDYFRTKFVIGLVVIPLPKLIAALGSFIVAAFLFWFLRSTDTGRCFRAAAQDREAAGLMGIDVNKIYYLAVGIGMGCLGIAGPLLIPLYYTSPEIGMLFTMLSFVIVVLGGLGSFTGAIVGGLIIGVSESLGAALFPGTLNHMITYIIFILILLFRPEGLLAVKSR